MNYWNKDKKPTGLNPQKKRTNWNQSLRSSGTKSNKPKKIKKSLQYLLVLKTLIFIDHKSMKIMALLN